LAKLKAASRRIWDTVRAEVEATPAVEQDRQRLLSVLEVRRDRSVQFFSAAAGDWDRMRSELFGSNADMLPLLALLDERMVVGDLGCGTGQIARILSPFVKQVIGIDSSAAMLRAAQRRAPSNTQLRQGLLEALPIGDAELDVALLFLVLHYVVEPARALSEAARVLKPGGHLLLIDMKPHDREELRETMGHVWLGFSAEHINEWLNAAGLTRIRHISLPVDARAKGPALFVARASKPSE
jgi:SAM-dependent methyltransferase